MENMEVWGTQHLKSNSPTVAAAWMFHKIHSLGIKKITNITFNMYIHGWEFWGVKPYLNPFAVNTCKKTQRICPALS